MAHASMLILLTVFFALLPQFLFLSCFYTHILYENPGSKNRSNFYQEDPKHPCATFTYKKIHFFHVRLGFLFLRKILKNLIFLKLNFGFFFNAKNI